MLASLVFAVLVSPTGAPEEQAFALYKWQQRIGRETSTVDRDPEGTEIRTAFAFTDRSRTVPLSSRLRLRPDGSPVRFELWGDTSRSSQADDLVVVEEKTVTIRQSGLTRTVTAPARFFVGSTYAPVIVIQELLRYWAEHGEPKVLPVFPIGDVTIERRGEDPVTDDQGKPRKLARYAIGGLEWGRETAWLEERGRLAALKAVDAEFDHFEATGRDFSEALPTLVARAAKDGMAGLLETSRSVGEKAAGNVAYVNARLIDVTSGKTVPNAAVLVDGDRVVSAGPQKDIALPVGVRLVDLAGKTLLPGLWDMHAHFEQVEWGPLYLAAGVTTARDCGNELDFVRGVRDAIGAGEGVGPRLLLACLVDGEGPAALGKTRIRSAEEIPGLLDRFKAAGCAQVKIYSSLDPRLIAPLAAAAHRSGMTVTGHVPTGIGAVHAVEAGLDQINHVGYLLRAFVLGRSEGDRELSSPEFRRAVDALDLAAPEAQELATWFARKGVVVDPTMALMELFSRPNEELAKEEPGISKLAGPLRSVFQSMGPRPEDAAWSHRFLSKELEVVGLLHRKGVTIVAGTDQAVPGHSLHRELELYVQAGFTPLEAIQAATIVPSRVMGRDKEVGTVAPGMKADFIVVDGDPLADIRTLRKITLVVAAGKAYEPARLWRSVGFEP